MQATWMRRSTEKRWCKSLMQDSPFRTLFTFGQLPCFFIFTWLINPWNLSKMHVQHFSKMDPTTETYRCMSTLIMGWGVLPFWPPRSLPTHVQTGKSSLTSGVGTLSPYFSGVQLLLLTLFLECLDENKAWILLHLKNQRCPAQSPIMSYLTENNCHFLVGLISCSDTLSWQQSA